MYHPRLTCDISTLRLTCNTSWFLLLLLLSLRSLIFLKYEYNRDIQLEIHYLNTGSAKARSANEMKLAANCRSKQFKLTLILRNTLKMDQMKFIKHFYSIPSLTKYGIPYIKPNNITSL